MVFPVAPYLLISRHHHAKRTVTHIRDTLLAFFSVMLTIGRPADRTPQNHFRLLYTFNFPSSFSKKINPTSNFPSSFLGGTTLPEELKRVYTDESMDEDVMESKHADSNIKSDALVGKSEITSELVLKEVSLLDADGEGSSAHPREVVAEEKPPTPAEKRKPEVKRTDQDIIVNIEPIKRQRPWNVDAVNISDQQASKLTGTGTPKDVGCSALKHSFDRPDTTTSRDSPKERIVPPSQKPETTSLRID